jgi:hypothetical protein
MKIKIVPDAIPNADGEWVDIPLDLAGHGHLRWRETERLVKPFVPEGYHVVAIESARHV